MELTLQDTIASKKKLIGMYLPIQIAVYVPSTKDANVPISKEELKTRVDEVRKYLANMFGGFSSEGLTGGYVSTFKELIKEDIIRVVAFSTKEAYEKNKQKLITQISNWAKEWSQEAIGVEFENDLYYINQAEAFEDGGKVEREESDFLQGYNFKNYEDMIDTLTKSKKERYDLSDDVDTPADFMKKLEKTIELANEISEEYKYYDRNDKMLVVKFDVILDYDRDKAIEKTIKEFKLNEEKAQELKQIFDEERVETDMYRYIEFQQDDIEETLRDFIELEICKDEILFTGRNGEYFIFQEYDFFEAQIEKLQDYIDSKFTSDGEFESNYYTSFEQFLQSEGNDVAETIGLIHYYNFAFGVLEAYAKKTAKGIEQYAQQELEEQISMYTYDNIVEKKYVAVRNTKGDTVSKGKRYYAVDFYELDKNGEPEKHSYIDEQFNSEKEAQDRIEEFNKTGVFPKVESEVTEETEETDQDGELIEETNETEYKTGGLVGKRIKMIYMNDKQAVEPDTMGTIVKVDGIGQYQVKWDNGRTLAIIPEEDKFEIMDTKNIQTATSLELVKMLKNKETSKDAVAEIKRRNQDKKEMGGSIVSERRFSEADFNKLVDKSDLKGIWNGYVWEIVYKNGGGFIFGKFNPKTKKLFIAREKDLSNPLVKYLQQNSYVSAEEYVKLADGGKVLKNWDEFDNGGGVDDNKFTYMMLGRLQSDCDYYLGHGNRSEKSLWAGSVDGQIEEMKRLWNMLSEKPQWLSMDDILEYEKKMKEEYSNGGGVGQSVIEFKVGDKVTWIELSGGILGGRILSINEYYGEKDRLGDSLLKRMNKLIQDGGYAWVEEYYMGFNQVTKEKTLTTTDTEHQYLIGLNKLTHFEDTKWGGKYVDGGGVGNQKYTTVKELMKWLGGDNWKSDLQILNGWTVDKTFIEDIGEKGIQYHLDILSENENENIELISIDKGDNYENKFTVDGRNYKFTTWDEPLVNDEFANGGGVGEILEGVVTWSDNGRYGESYLKLNNNNEVLFVPRALGQIWFADKIKYKVISEDGYEKPTGEMTRSGGGVYFGHRGKVIEIISINRKGVDVVFKKYDNGGGIYADGGNVRTLLKKFEDEKPSIALYVIAEMVAETFMRTEYDKNIVWEKLTDEQKAKYNQDYKTSKSDFEKHLVYSFVRLYYSNKKIKEKCKGQSKQTIANIKSVMNGIAKEYDTDKFPQVSPVTESELKREQPIQEVSKEIRTAPLKDVSDELINKAITEALLLPKFKNLTREEADFIYKSFANYENQKNKLGEYVYEIQWKYKYGSNDDKAKSEDEKLKKFIEKMDKHGIITFSNYDGVIEADKAVIDFINSVRGRVYAIKGKSVSAEIPKTDTEPIALTEIEAKRKVLMTLIHFYTKSTDKEKKESLWSKVQDVKKQIKDMENKEFKDGGNVVFTKSDMLRKLHTLSKHKETSKPINDKYNVLNNVFKLKTGKDFDNVLRGGKADGMDEVALAKKHGVSVATIRKQIEKGVEVEREHIDNYAIQREIALDHIEEFVDYYDRLAKMEKQAKVKHTIQALKGLSKSQINSIGNYMKNKGFDSSEFDVYDNGTILIYKDVDSRVYKEISMFIKNNVI